MHALVVDMGMRVDSGAQREAGCKAQHQAAKSEAKDSSTKAQASDSNTCH